VKKEGDLLEIELSTPVCLDVPLLVLGDPLLLGWKLCCGV
jgi:hypothetical protein